MPGGDAISRAMSNPVTRAKMYRKALGRFIEDDLAWNHRSRFWDTDIEGMRSWSLAYRRRAIHERNKREAIKEADRDIDRAIKESLLPEWMSRFR